jgi:putative ABC transport system permease protein
VVAAGVAAITFGSSLGHLLDDPARWGDAPLTAGAGGGAVSDDVRATLAEDADVADLAYGATVLASVGATSIDVSSIEAVRGDADPYVFSGRLPVADDEIALGKVTARDLHVGIGDAIEVAGAGGRSTFTVTGLIVVPSIEGGDGVGSGGVVTPEALVRIDPEAQFTMVRMSLRPDAPADTVPRLSAAIAMAIGPSATPTTILNLQRIRSVPYVVAAALGLLVVLSLGHRLVISTWRRNHDVAVLRALGADRRWISSVVHSQATVVVAAAVALALPIGFVSGRLVFHSFIDRTGARNDVVVSPGLLLVAVGALFVLANVVGAITARRARSAPPSRYLSTE